MDNAAKIPEWAVKEACDSVGLDPVEFASDIESFARLLVSTREAALREAADSLREWANIPSGYIGAIETKILALIDKEPAS